VAAGYFEHTPNGAHLAYRCAEIEGNTKLATSATTGKALIETRGEGGFIVVAPSHGGVNRKGEYVLQSGGPDKIATISPSERRSLWDVARIMDESVKPQDHVAEYGAALGGRPGDEFNQQASWEDVLCPAGWRKVSSRLGVVSWRRPGKEDGISATTNHAGSDLFFCFSTSTEFEANRGYSKFSVYALLNHGGDFSAAASELRLQGYGLEVPDTPAHGEVDLSLFLANFGRQSRYEPAPLDSLLRVPGLIGELAEWINLRSPKPQPILALGASIAAMSAVLGRKVQTRSGLRSNLFVLGVGETGCGKDAARQCIKLLFEQIGAGKMIGESFASGPAIEEAITRAPSCLYLIDEMGALLTQMRGGNAPTYIQQIKSVLLKVYSSSASVYHKTLRAMTKEDEVLTVVQPSLSLYATTVPSNLFGGLSSSDLRDGFLSRFLVFESDDPDPFYRETDQAPPPEGLISGFGHWAKPASLTQLSPDPVVVSVTEGARSVFDGLELRLRDKRKALRDMGQEHGPYTRVHATAIKLALCRACGIKILAPEITKEDAQWGADLAVRLTDRFIEQVGDKIADSHSQAVLNDVLSAVASYGSTGCTRAKLSSHWSARKHCRKDRNDALADLLESGRVVSTGPKEKPVFRVNQVIQN
jgi:hypothetical protein